MSEEGTICPICGENIDNSHCEVCWAEVTGKLGELSSIKYHINNCVNDDDDVQSAEQIILLAEDLIRDAHDFIESFKKGVANQ